MNPDTLHAIHDVVDVAMYVVPFFVLVRIAMACTRIARVLDETPGERDQRRANEGRF